MLGGVFFLFLVLLIHSIMTLKRKESEAYTMYTIKKGNHCSHKDEWPLALKISLAPKVLRFTAIFSEGCAYNSNEAGDHINKLYGISYGFDHHYRSVRVGWRHNSNLGVIELFSYSYVKGERVIKKLINVKQYEPVHFIIFRKNSTDIIIHVNDECATVTDVVKGIDKEGVRFKLFPYFGGNPKAPNNMKIFIKETVK